MIGVVLIVALLSGGAALFLTLAAPVEHAERYTNLASVFMETFKMCVGALIGAIATARLR